jgi:hypothetical protein
MASGTGGQIFTPKRPDSRARGGRARRRTQRQETGPEPSGWTLRFGWRWVSGGMVVLIGAALAIIFTNPIFYVTQVEVGGVRAVSREDIFADTGIAGYHVFWMDPSVIEEQVTASASIESAEVVVLWPARVLIYVHEREPALVWEQEGRRYWVDINGNLMAERYEIPGLVTVISEEGSPLPYRCPGPGCPEGAVTIDPAVILGVQHLKTLQSSINVLYYDSVRGLSYQDERGWRVYFGVGADMSRRLVVYEALVDNLLSRGIRPAYVDVSNPEAPLYRVDTTREP